MLKNSCLNPESPAKMTGEKENLKGFEDMDSSGGFNGCIIVNMCSEAGEIAHWRRCLPCNGPCTVP